MIIDDFLPKNIAEKLLLEFPSPCHDCWLERDVVNQPKKLGIGHVSRLEGVSPFLHNILFAFNSYPFIHFLESLIGIPKLLPDPNFSGAGVHQTLQGGKLNVHTDFNYLEKIGLYRRVNVIFFLNKEWGENYGGELELWDAEKKACVTKIEPIFNRIAIFATNKKTYHGHPKPLSVPDGVTRKSLAIYYYTSDLVEGEVYNKNTSWL